MSLLRKDVKMGMFAGAALLALAASYFGVLALFGDSDKRADLALAAPTESLQRSGSAETPVDDDNGILDDVDAVDPGDATPNDSLLVVGAARGQYDAREAAGAADDVDDNWGTLLPEKPIITNAFDTSADAQVTPDDSTFDGMTPIEDTIIAADGDAVGLDMPRSYGDAAGLTSSGSSESSDGSDWDEAELAASGDTSADTSGATQTAASTDATTDAAPAPIKRTHTLASGDNYSTLSLKYYGTAKHFDYIRRANPQLDPTRLQIGDIVNIPAAPAATPADTNAPSLPLPAGTVTYTVESGDTLSRIAEKKLGRAQLWERLYELNRDIIGSNPKALKVGMVLRLPS